MITLLDKTANIFEQPSDAYVIPVNTVGVAGKGLAKLCKDKYPDWYKEYKSDCKIEDLRVGHLTLYYCESVDKYLINFPTKINWRNPSRLTYIDEGLANLNQLLKQPIISFTIKSITIPALGCGLGGLNFEDVKQLIEQHLGDLEINIYLIPPHWRG